ncbi:hypothetical protein NJC40_03415 [Pseudomonas sp. 21LCFQ02]|uniref:hypothetical protein n=1 Tax=Pseudomonas sp. 21LCFQ02 TaxID=2957505 RepID=UPI00209AA228|nr:hypothetical protein [Pseudomonas sp. 21LCFQ02]MCO8166826.1 hypothetical protein [Pseudomonas sp. 21LCFQ02]
MKMLSFKTVRLVLSGALLGVAAANAFFGVNFPGEIVAGVLGAGGALALMKLTAIV